MHTGIQYTLILVSERDNGSNGEGEARALFTTMCVRPFNYKMFSSLISLWC
ncbi:hypothetical protein E2C01_021968 [Portunus trituberculatus]|uniref:Uncharacterized protein n=1 Tax=Portunus trituberculatus TaxID=210409 RepID=A0A5B7E601_PORTR|nr:hypothetical protein [Portunus trituberculatus]